MANEIERMASGRLFRTRWLPVLLYVAIIFTLSAQPGLQVPGAFELRDKFAHVLEYGGLGVLGYRAARDTWSAVPAPRRALLTLLAVCAIGAADEKFQSYVPLRESTVYDWYADAMGASLAAGIGFAFEKRRGGA